MCGRAYQTYTEEELYLRYLTEKGKRDPLGSGLAPETLPRPLKDFHPNYNLSPTQNSPVVLVPADSKTGERTIQEYRWGLIPFWAKDVKSASRYSLINAVAEEIETKRSYAAPFKHRRCIVPLSGFYEWKKLGEKNKQPYAIRLKSREILSVPAVYEHWEDRETGNVIRSFSLLTTAANEFMKGIHDRMPLILGSEDEEAWLDPRNEDTLKLKSLLKALPADKLEAFRISTLVNSPRNNGPELLAPAGES